MYCVVITNHIILASGLDFIDKINAYYTCITYQLSQKKSYKLTNSSKAMHLFKKTCVNHTANIISRAVPG